jgi:predicted RNA-binding Zn ribbon-like protein
MTRNDLPAMFVADSRGLDFLNSIATPVDEPVDWIGTGDGLLDWMNQAALVDAETLETFRDGALPGELDAVAARARALREWFRDFVQRNKGADVGAGELAQLEPINQILARDEQFLQMVSQPEGAPALRHVRRWRTAESLLLPLAEAIADLVCHDGLRDVKACEGHRCTLLFVDRTRGHRRRWCSMAVCGNRAKQATHRERVQRG